jgi:hypothetical protein
MLKRENVEQKYIPYSSICNHAKERKLGTKIYQFINISEFVDHKKPS